MTCEEAEKTLRGTLSSDKNEILHERFNINYNNENEFYKKGTTIIRQYYNEKKELLDKYPDSKKIRKLCTVKIETIPCDLIKDNPLKLNHK